ncbi:hypothetical protein IFM60648_04028 [Aspergillus lentulus]|uniref:Uncharacterized protein n=1 Tax=Aspergillus lentulus TaxID=293939 RepID=A0ABQ1A565_ASPLE|nr:hypothetical protein IFM60648_04028 [Aspergillus lentulus]
MPGTVRRPSWLKTIVRTGGTASNSPMSLKRTPFFENRPPLANSSCIVAGPRSGSSLFDNSFLARPPLRCCITFRGYSVIFMVDSMLSG